MDRRRFIQATAAGAIAARTPGALAQSDPFPSRTVRILVPFSAGALTDVIARIYAEKLSPRLGHNVIVENKPGAAGVVASQALLQAPADGHTLMFVSSSHAVNPSLHQKLPYDTLKDFAGVALLASSPNVLVVNADSPLKSVDDIVARAKKEPNSVNFGSAGKGAATHLAGEFFRNQTGTQLVHVPFKGVQEAVMEVMAGRIDMAFPPIALAKPHIDSGKLRPLLVTGTDRVAQLPQTPTAIELGMKDFEYSIWYALVAPSQVPRRNLKALAREVRAVTQSLEVREKLMSQGLVMQSLELAEFDRFIARDVERLGRIVAMSGAAAN